MHTYVDYYDIELPEWRLGRGPYSLSPLARSQRRSYLEADGIDVDDDGLEEGKS